MILELSQLFEGDEEFYNLRASFFKDCPSCGNSEFSFSSYMNLPKNADAVVLIQQLEKFIIVLKREIKRHG